MDFQIKVDDREIKRFLRGFPKEIAPAMMQSLNKTMARTHTYVAKEMGREKDNPFTAKEMKGRMQRFKATRLYLNAALWVKGGKGSKKSIYKGSTKAVTATPAGVKYKPRTGPAKVIPHTFIATMKSGHKGVFKRRGDARLKIDEMWMASVRQMFNRKRITTKRDAFASKEWGIQVQRAIKDRLRRYNAWGGYVGVSYR